MIEEDSEHNTEEKLLAFLVELRDELVRSSGITQPTRVKAKEFDSDHTMRILVPFLFNQQQQLSPNEALGVMGALVTSDPARYLKSASRAVLQEATRLANTPDAPMHVTTELLQATVMQLYGDDTQVAENASHLLTTCCRKLGSTFARSALEALQQTWQTAWHQMTTTTNTGAASTTSVRCASVMVDIALQEDRFMELALSTGATSVWTTMLCYQQDPLLQLSVLDLFEKLATSQPFQPSRTHWLLASVEDPQSPVHIILQMSGGFGNDDDDEHNRPDPLLGGAALRVVAALCAVLQLQEDANSSSPPSPSETRLLSAFHQALHYWEESSGGEVDRLTMVHAISSFAAASDQALELVLDDPVTRQAWLSIRQVAQTKLKAAILVSIAQVLDPDMNENNSRRRINRPSNTLGTKLFSLIGPTNDQSTTMDLLMTLVKSPMPEIRLGVYVVWEAAAKLPTGGQVLLMHPDFLTFLLTRENESTHEGRKAKFAVVQAIGSSSVRGLLADPIVQKLDTYVKQGPFFYKAKTWDVAVED